MGMLILPEFYDFRWLQWKEKSGTLEKMP